MSFNALEGYGPKHLNSLIIKGSIIVIAALTALLLIYDIAHGTLGRPRFWAAIVALAYLFVLQFIAKKGYLQLSNWLLIFLYQLIAAIALASWGLGSSAGMLAACFVILLPGILMAPKSILPVALVTVAIILGVYHLHSLQIIKPDLTPLTKTSQLDVFAYVTILSIFALVSWASARHSERSLKRAINAEEVIRQQNMNLSVELERESSQLRQLQLQQVLQLHKFAVIGQSTTALLHELSNHLSILNLDIDDFKQQHKNSRAIANAEDAISQINKIVRQARAQLNSYNANSSFNAVSAINRTAKDLKQKYKNHNVELYKPPIKGSPRFYIKGSPTGLMQVITVLLNNALDACYNLPNARVTLSMHSQEKQLLVIVEDTGPGFDDSAKKTLFQPVESNKPTGLGVGLYIAKHLVESQFAGTLKLVPSKLGAKFEIILPKQERP